MKLDEQMTVLGLHKSKVALEWRPNCVMQDGWLTVREDHQFDFDHLEYRRKPRVPRDFWVNLYPDRVGNAWKTQEAALQARFIGVACETIHVFEDLSHP